MYLLLNIIIYISNLNNIIYIMNIKFIICIILGIILYILINKIEGLICRGPLDNALGNPNPEATIGKLNNGSLPFFPKNNVMVTRRVDGQKVYISENSKHDTWDNGDVFELKCSGGLRDEEDIHRKQLAPYTPLTSQGNILTCHNPSKKVIFYRMHSGIYSIVEIRGILMHGSINTGVTKIPKKMQLIFYINDGDCYSEPFTNSMSVVQNIFRSIYNGDDIVEQNLLSDSVEGTDDILLNKGFSELETINGIYMLIIDSKNVLIQIKTQNSELVVFNSSQDNIYSMTCNIAFFSKQNIPHIPKLILGTIYNHKINLLNAIGPYSGTFPIIDFSDNNNRLDKFIDKYPNVLLLENYVSVEQESGTFTYTYDMVHMEDLKLIIQVLIRSQSEMVPISYLSPTFQSGDSFRRLFNGNVEIELPIFCLSILSHPYFANPVGTRYALPGGRYIYQDLIDLIFDIIGQITSDEESVVKSVYYRKMRSLGMSDDEIDTFLSQCNFLYTTTSITYSIPENFPLLPFMRLWEPWNYPTTDRSDHIIYDWSMQTFLLLIQLFKQEEGEAIDVHSFTCLEGIGEGDRTKNNAKMDYSWQYAYSNDEANNPDKRIGPECQRPVCPQSEDEINSKLEELGLRDFIVESESYSSEQNRYPKSSEIIYTKNEGNITIDRDYIEPTGITVQCRNRPEITEKLICKYDEDGEETLNYDESIGQLDPSNCLERNCLERNSDGLLINPDGSIIGQSQLDENVCGPSLLSLSPCSVRLNFGV